MSGILLCIYVKILALSVKLCENDRENVWWVDVFMLAHTYVNYMFKFEVTGELPGTGKEAQIEWRKLEPVPVTLTDIRWSIFSISPPDTPPPSDGTAGLMYTIFSQSVTYKSLKLLKVPTLAYKE